MGAVRTSSQKPYVHQAGNHRHDLNRNGTKIYDEDVTINDKRPIKLLWVGGIWPRKGLKVLIDALHDKLYYKEANPDDTDSMHKTVSDIGNMLEHRLEKYLYGIKCRNNLAKIVLSYYEDGVINKEQLNVEYEVFLKSGDKANYYKSDEEIKRLLPDLRKDMTGSSTIIELNQFADSYIIWSDILEENNESVEFMGIAYTEEDLYAHVLAMEQIMSTGGGWQDQVGGITPGLKYITSMPGIDQKLKVTHVEIPEAAKQELSDRFVLIYTGQRRLARNLLRDVVGRYVGNEPESLFALEEIQKTAALMRFELERGNVDGFASLLDYHWELSKKVDAGSSNTLIEQIFSSIEELIVGKLVCGAGGGGFLQVILKKGVTRQQVEERLNEVFMDSLVGVADCRLVWE